MIVIQAVVWPHGMPPDSDYAIRRGDDFTILSLIVANDGTGNRDTGNYDVWEGEPNPSGDQTHDGWTRLGRIEGVPRGTTHRAYLTRKALELLERTERPGVRA